MANFLRRWFVLTLSVMAAAHVVPGIAYRGLGALLSASLLLGLLNVLVRPLLILFSLPLAMLTFGFFLLAINTVLFYLTGHLVHGFEVQTWTAAFFGSLICNLLGMLLRHVQRPPVASSTSRSDSSRDGGGRIIDI